MMHSGLLPGPSHREQRLAHEMKEKRKKELASFALGRAKRKKRKRAKNKRTH